MLYVKETFNDENLKKNYNVVKKNFVDFCDKYILFLYFAFIIISILLTILLNNSNIIYLKGYMKKRIFIFFKLVDLTYYIISIIKTIYTNNILKEEYADKIWFSVFGMIVIIFSSCFILAYLCIIYKLGKKLHERVWFYDDQKVFILNNINGININAFKLPNGFYNLNEKDKIKLIFKKENIKNYNYKLNLNQINLIQEINNIRKQYNIPELNYDKNEKLPDFIINPKIELIWYPNEKINKLSTNYYLFKYPKNEFKNYLNVKQILNIITIEFLDKIKIIEQNNIEFISIYKNNNNIDISISNNNIKQPNIIINKIKLSEINSNNTEENSKMRTINISKNELSNENGYEGKIIRNLKINKNYFENK